MKFDAIVVGGGVVGAAMARALRGLRVALIDAEPYTAPTPDSTQATAAPWDARVYALSPGNVRFLQDLGVWPETGLPRACPVHAMLVQGDTDGSHISFDALRSGVSELAWIVEDRALREALSIRVQQQDDLRYFSGARAVSLKQGTDSIVLTLAQGQRLEANVLIGADGANSSIRPLAGLNGRDEPYGQTAVVANFSCAQPHQQIARQWFTGGPVLALLPLPGQRVSMVWSLPDADASRMCSLTAQELCIEVMRATNACLGTMACITAPRAVPLRRMQAARSIAPHLALIGDAAHCVHPLAGQGLNLGLHDVRDLSAAILGRSVVQGVGDWRVLRRYERARKEAVLVTSSMMHGLYGLFSTTDPLVKRARQHGLNWVDRLPMLKRQLMQHAIR